MPTLFGALLFSLTEKFEKPFDRNLITKWNCFNKEAGFFSREELVFIDNKLKTKGFCRSLEVIYGINQAIESLLELNHEIIFLTSQWVFSPTWCYDRRKWIFKHFGDVFIKYQKSIKIIYAWEKELIMGDILIDDNPDNLSKWIAEMNRISGDFRSDCGRPKPRGFLFRQPWNLIDGPKMVSWGFQTQFMNGWEDEGFWKAVEV